MWRTLPTPSSAGITLFPAPAEVEEATSFPLFPCPPMRRQGYHWHRYHQTPGVTVHYAFSLHPAQIPPDTRGRGPLCIFPAPSSTGTDAGDHPPITPMRAATRDQVRDSDWRLYDFITRHFLATVSKSLAVVAVCQCLGNILLNYM